MGLGNWLKNLFKKDEEEVVCPKCGCKDFATFTYLANFVEVMREVEPARYVTSGKCNACGYTIQDMENPE